MSQTPRMRLSDNVREIITRNRHTLTLTDAATLAQAAREIELAEHDRTQLIEVAESLRDIAATT